MQNNILEHMFLLNKCAVFGANGYIGSQFSYLLGKQARVSMFDIQDEPVLSGDSVYSRFDVTESGYWANFDPANYDFIFFFSGLTGTNRSFTEAERYLAVNEGGLLRLCQKLAPLGEAAPKIIFPSTRLVYKGRPGLLTEDAEKETKTLYAVNKLACENILYAYHSFFGIPYVVMRICVPYGAVYPTDYPYGTIGMFLRQARQGRPIILFGGGLQRRTFTHTADLCTACIRIANSSTIVSGVFNVGGEQLALSSAAQIIAEKFGISVESSDWPDADFRVESGDTVFDDSKLENEIGSYLVNDFRNWVASH